MIGTVALWQAEAAFGSICLPCSEFILLTCLAHYELEGIDSLEQQSFGWHFGD